MSHVPHRLHLAPRSRTAPVTAPEGTLEDLLLLAAILAVALFPIVSTLAGVGQWGNGSLGLATLGSIFSGRELLRLVAARLRARRQP